MTKMWLVVALLAASCGGKKEEKIDNKGGGGGGGGGGGDKPNEKPKADGPFAEFGSNEDTLKKWQGAWVVESGALGHYEAWEVKGNVITAFDGTKEKKLELSVQAPCQAKVVENDGKGGSSGTTAVFVFEGDKLHAGMGNAGMKKGSKILACGGGQIYVSDGAKCTAYEESMFKKGEWEAKPTECKLEGTTFTAKRAGMGDMTSTFVVEGDLLMSEQMKGNKPEKATDFADAKAKLAARKK